MASIRRILLTILPKVALSRATGLITRIPVPPSLRNGLFGLFARRYGADLGEMQGTPRDYRSFRAFFRRPLAPGARPVAADAALVWPCDGKIVTTGPVREGRIPQVKGVDYPVEELVGDSRLAAELDGGTQATIYLAPGDYHRVHAPFGARVEDVRPLRGTLFPVNPPAVRAIPRLFVRNARHVFHCRLADGRAAAVVMVGALNVGDTKVTCEAPAEVVAGDELGQFGFGSTVVVVVAPGGAGWADVAPETVVRTGASAPTA